MYIYIYIYTYTYILERERLRYLQLYRYMHSIRTKFFSGLQSIVCPEPSKGIPF